MSHPHGRLTITFYERKKMAIFEFSDGFDAVGWYTEQMGKGHNFESHEDPYGWDEPAEYPY